jgi:hypothetical protein
VLLQPDKRCAGIILQLLLLFYFGAPTACVAGYVPEANVVYADLSSPSSPGVEEKLRDSVNSDMPACWKRGEGLIYMYKRPKGITNALLFSALLKRSSADQAKLNDLLVSYVDQEVSGFDGVVVYVNAPAPRFISFNAKTKGLRATNISNVNLRRDVELAFCSLKPDIVTLP